MLPSLLFSVFVSTNFKVKCFKNNHLLSNLFKNWLINFIQMLMKIEIIDWNFLCRNLVVFSNIQYHAPFYIKLAVNIFLPRKCYLAMRNILFSVNSNNKQVCSKILADEMHIKPSVRPKNHNYSVDEPTKGS